MERSTPGAFANVTSSPRLNPHVELSLPAGSSRSRPAVDRQLSPDPAAEWSGAGATHTTLERLVAPGADGLRGVAHARPHRERINDRPVTWHVHYAGVRVGMIVERAGWRSFLI